MSVPTRITFKHVATLFRSIIEKDNNKVLLGRWGLTENKNTNLVIDYSNEDHCGTCSQYALQKQKIEKKSQCDDELFKYEFEYLSANTQQKV
tara:strand:- start:3429 stop:3704 length:276 start_codon:yes stop_codon:yes gene_type:complete